MSPITCPLAAKQPLADLTAESARNAVKTFEGLDYSLEEASTAAYVEEQITKHSRLGFTQCVLQDMKVSDKMRTYLEGKGFRVSQWWTATCGPNGASLPRSHYTETAVWTAVSWGEPVVIPEGAFQTHGEAREHAEALRQKAEREDEEAWEIRKQNALLDTSRKKSLNEQVDEALGYKQPAPTPPPSGCLPLLLALPTALYFLLS